MNWTSTIAGAVLAIGLLCRQMNTPEGLWKAHGATIGLGLLVLAFPTQAGLIWRSFRLDRLLKRDEAYTLVRELCNSMLVFFVSSEGIPATCLGIHVWVPKSGIPGWRPESLTRIVTFKLHKSRESGVVWVKGKGAVGSCWKQNLEEFFDLGNLHELAKGGEAKFTEVKETDRQSLTWADFQKTQAYWAVWVSPLRSGPKFIGCISIDCTDPAARDKIRAAVAKPIVPEFVGLIERALTK